ncbi:MAG: hypothetical protein RL180_171 [Pseudomonadota bacterium]
MPLCMERWHEWLGLLLGFGVVVAAAWRTRQSGAANVGKVFAQMLVYYGLGLFGLLIPFTVWHWWIGQQSTPAMLLLVALSLLMVYSRFIEPNRLVTRHQRIVLDPERPLATPLRVVLIADIHVGLFSGGKRQLRRIVQQVNALNADCVVVAGDWTYEAGDDLLSWLAPLGQLNGPVYSVAGNHDEALPGPPIQHELHHALLSLNIQPIEGELITAHPSVYLYGTGDLWAGKADLTALRFFPQDKPWIVVAHNPDTVDHIPSGLSHRPLMLSGHTHGGQVNVPWLTAWVLKTQSVYGFVVGLYDLPKAQIYVTAGTGMVGVPLRFCMPPSIDLLELV